MGKLSFRRVFDLSLAETADIFYQIQEGLRDLKKANLCHGDLSPQNIMLTCDGLVKIIDISNGLELLGWSRMSIKSPKPLSEGRLNRQSKRLVKRA